MKTTVVPAQVTTVEDRIMGNLGFSQLVLIVLPVFIGAGLFVFLPPLMKISLYKYIVIGFISFIACILAIRIRGKIVLLWLITILRFNLRPKYYLFDKNTTALREQYRAGNTELEEVTETKEEAVAAFPTLEYYQTAQVLAAIDDPARKLRFETTRKGGLHVRLTEIEE